MRVGLFTDTYPPYINGVSTSVLMLKKALEARGHQVFVVTTNNDNLKYKYEENNTVIRIPGLPVGLYDYRLSGIYPIKIVSQIRKWKLDVIHSHTEFGLGTFARIISKQFNIPLVHTYHTMYEDYIHYITKGYFKGVSKKIVEYLTLFYCDKTISELVVPSKKAYNLFKEKYKVNRNVYIVPNGIEVEKFHRSNFDFKDIYDMKKRLEIKKEDFVLLYVGRIAKEKNIDFLLDVQKLLLRKYKNIKLLIVGDGPDFNDLKKKSERPEFNNSIIFTGKVPLSEVAKYYQIGDIFVTASKSENYSVTIIEALSASLPVVCIEDESFENVVVNDLDGYIFKNKKQCIDQIVSIYTDKDRLMRLKKQALIIGDSHSSKYYGQRIEDVYNIAIGNKKKTIIEKFKEILHKE